VAATVGGAQAGEEPAALEGLQKYCAASWRNAGITKQDWPDCTQEAMAILLERISRKQLSHAIQNGQSPERRELNRSIWCTIQRWRRAPRHVSLDHYDTIERKTDERLPEAAEELENAMAVAERCVTARQRQILSLSGDGWSIREIAEKLDISSARVSDEKYKAIRKLRQRLAATG
jgi:RNA polymerase sigma factor (sigma-70 family)